MRYKVPPLDYRIYPLVGLVVKHTSAADPDAVLWEILEAVCVDRFGVGHPEEGADGARYWVTPEPVDGPYYDAGI